MIPTKPPSARKKKAVSCAEAKIIQRLFFSCVVPLGNPGFLSPILLSSTPMPTFATAVSSLQLSQSLSDRSLLFSYLI